MEGQAGADRVAEIILAHTSKRARAVISAVNWGEVTTMLLREHGTSGADEARAGLSDLRLGIVVATAQRAVRSAEIKFKYKIPYADAFCVELASDSSDHILVTADFDMMPAANDIAIEFLPPKPKP
jgi:predicted nucleic acid-binding protein